jgi:hypothetical protein
MAGHTVGPCAVSRRCRLNALLLPHSRSKGPCATLRWSLGRVSHLGRAAPSQVEGTRGVGGAPPGDRTSRPQSMANPDSMLRCATACVCDSVQPGGSRLCCMCHNGITQTRAAARLCEGRDADTAPGAHPSYRKSLCQALSGKEHAPTRPAACPAVQKCHHGGAGSVPGPPHLPSPSSTAPPHSSAYA